MSYNPLVKEYSAEIKFEAGTLVLEGDTPYCVPPRFEWDPRIDKYRAPAVARRGAVGYLERRDIQVHDVSSAARDLDIKLRLDLEPRPYQKEALKAWIEAGRCGTVVLPTGAGKTYIALGAIADVRRSSMIVAPTIDLMSQWYSLLTDAFGIEIGLLGGGYHEIRDITVTTYDSAHIYAGQYGNRFDLIVFDEAHHLPSPKYRQIPEMSTAWCRLGLTATYERQDGAHELLEFLIGPVVYRLRIQDIRGKYLSDYETVRIKTSLTKEEAKRYQECAERYLAFIRRAGLKPFGPGWVEFIHQTSMDQEARSALLAKQEMKRIIVGAQHKLDVLDSILKQHWADRVLIFTEYNQLVYRISREFLIPAITHETKSRERKFILDGFKEGIFHAIVTSKVLNEGIDVPSAKVAVVLSGSASPREYVQRLGRILRRSGVRQKAVLYEVITSATAETNVSSRRRKTDAYA